MKCIREKKTGYKIRVTDEVAEQRVKSGLYEYISKEEFHKKG